MATFPLTTMSFPQVWLQGRRRTPQPASSRAPRAARGTSRSVLLLYPASGPEALTRMHSARVNGIGAFPPAHLPFTSHTGEMREGGPAASANGHGLAINTSFPPVAPSASSYQHPSYSGTPQQSSYNYIIQDTHSVPAPQAYPVVDFQPYYPTPTSAIDPVAYPWSPLPSGTSAYDFAALDQLLTPSLGHQIDWTTQAAPSFPPFVGGVAESALATAPSSSAAAKAYWPTTAPSSSSAMTSNVGLLGTPPDTSTTPGPCAAAAATGRPPVPSTTSFITTSDMGALATPPDSATVPSSTIFCDVQSDGTRCGLPIFLQPGVDNERSNGLRKHIREHHPSLMPRNKAKIDCTWSSCVCHKCRTPLDQTTHVAHVEDVPLHIWNNHLNLTRTCENCDAFLWGSLFSLKRHRKGCLDQEHGPPRCDICFVEFPSRALFRLHLQHGGCTHG
jgi:hypothetical protein